VGADIVEFPPKGIENSLLRSAGFLHWANGLTFQCAMHPLMRAVLIGPSRQDALMLNSKSHPPHVEIR
jgi:hypothetical protein